MGNGPPSGVPGNQAPIVPVYVQHQQSSQANTQRSGVQVAQATAGSALGGTDKPVSGLSQTAIVQQTGMVDGNYGSQNEGYDLARFPTPSSPDISEKQAQGAISFIENATLPLYRILGGDTFNPDHYRRTMTELNLPRLLAEYLSLQLINPSFSQESMCELSSYAADFASTSLTRAIKQVNQCEDLHAACDYVSGQELLPFGVVSALTAAIFAEAQLTQESPATGRTASVADSQNWESLTAQVFHLFNEVDKLSTSRAAVLTMPSERSSEAPTTLANAPTAPTVMEDEITVMTAHVMGEHRQVILGLYNSIPVVVESVRRLMNSALATKNRHASSFSP